MPLNEKIVPMFFVDAMLGNIAKKLRIMGFDCRYDSQIEDKDLINDANKENRIIISRDVNMVKQSSKFGIKSVLLEEEEEFDQLCEIIRKLDLKNIGVSGNNARCPKCNFKTESIEKKSIYNRIPLGVKQKNERFWICRNCDKIFWEGSHMIKLKKLVRELNEKL